MIIATKFRVGPLIELRFAFRVADPDHTYSKLLNIRNLLQYQKSLMPRCYYSTEFSVEQKRKQIIKKLMKVAALKAESIGETEFNI
uniref:Ribosomal protein S10 n=1 Tax=Romanomermis culicivorax TaxID=13658 RepID=A0A915HWF3_ROMCU